MEFTRWYETRQVLGQNAACGPKAKTRGTIGVLPWAGQGCTGGCTFVVSQVFSVTCAWGGAESLPAAPNAKSGRMGSVLGRLRRLFRAFVMKPARKHAC